MSEYRVGIIAEGPTDLPVIKAIVKLVFSSDTFIFTDISPTSEEISKQKKKEGFGWGGVYRVCKGLKDRLELLSLAQAPFDFLIVHLDGDVATKTYSSIKEVVEPDAVTDAAQNDTVAEICFKLESVLKKWINSDTQIIIPCIPYICTETWAGNWLYPDEWEQIVEESSEEAVYQLLIQLGHGKIAKKSRLIYRKDGKPKKVTSNYRTLANHLTKELWENTITRYSQAKKFETYLCGFSDNTK